MHSPLLARLLVVAAALGMLPPHKILLSNSLTIDSLPRQRLRLYAYAHISAAEYAHRQRVKMAHDLVMGVTFAILLPLAAALIRMGKYKSKVCVHASVQKSAIVLAITGLGLGVWLARKYNIVSLGAPPPHNHAALHQPTPA